MNLLHTRISLSARVIAGFYLMAAFWPHRMEKGKKTGQNAAIKVFAHFFEPLQTTHFKEVTCPYRRPVVLS